MSLYSALQNIPADTRMFALVDLDDTLFRSLRKCPPGMAAEQLTQMATAKDGSPLCYATPGQAHFLKLLKGGAEIIPVTARNSPTLARADVPWRVAIVSNGGGLVTRQGTDAGWAAEVNAEVTQYRGRLYDLCDMVARFSGSSGLLLPSVVCEGEVALYVGVKHRHKNPGQLQHLSGFLQDRAGYEGWHVHYNDASLAFMPPPLGKGPAVRKLLEVVRHRWPHAFVMGVGDSTTDAEFMLQCDMLACPGYSQLAEIVREAVND